MKLSAIAKLYGLDDVHERCNNLLKNMRLKTLSETVHLEDLDAENARHFLEQRIERLETFLDVLYPQFLGLMGCTLWLMKEGKKYVKWCKDHAPDGEYSHKCGPKELSTCELCDDMLYSVVNASISRKYMLRGGIPTQDYHYGGQYRFDKSLPSIIGEFWRLNKAD